jgi:hypothetical protein
MTDDAEVGALGAALMEALREADRGGRRAPAPVRREEN